MDRRGGETRRRDWEERLGVDGETGSRRRDWESTERLVAREM